jgi:hypothetical protein
MPARLPEPLLRCRLCQTQMHRIRHPSGELESLKRFSRRVYCSKRCYTEHQRRESKRNRVLWRRLNLRYVAA